MTGKPLHADFYVLEKGKKITINIPLEFVGVGAGGKTRPHHREGVARSRDRGRAAGIAASNLPVDISKLEKVGDHILASQIPLPPSAELKTGADEIVVSVTEFKEEKLEETPTPVVPAEDRRRRAKAGAAEGRAEATDHSRSIRKIHTTAISPYWCGRLVVFICARALVFLR